MREILSEIAATSWRDWLAAAFQLTGMVIIVVSIALIAIGFAP